MGNAIYHFFLKKRSMTENMLLQQYIEQIGHITCH